MITDYKKIAKKTYKALFNDSVKSIDIMIQYNCNKWCWDVFYNGKYQYSNPNGLKWAKSNVYMDLVLKEA